MMKTKLAKAISLTIAGAALSAAATSASAHVMYNLNVAANPVGGTDGWVWGGQGNPNYNTTPTANFSGVSTAGATPFGYNGTSHLNWAAALHDVGDTYEVSEAAGGVEVDTGAGAWQDAGIDNSGNLTTSGPTGWKHQTDIGLIKADHDMWVQINIARVSAPVGGPSYLPSALVNDNFGVTIFSGMDTNTGSYSHHGSWNCPGCTPAKPFTANDPFGTSGLTYVKHDGTVDMANSISFLATAGQVYSIYLGGAGAGRWNQNISDYALTIRTSAVPVPAAAWLFGGALMSLFGANRRKKGLPA